MLDYVARYKFSYVCVYVRRNGTGTDGKIGPQLKILAGYAPVHE